jgi:hypothetical protein
MPEAKTKPTEISVKAFLESCEPETRREEGRVLDALFRRVTGWEPRMWGPSMVGYGRYEYTYDSGRSGAWFATGFSPRKADLVVYVIAGHDEFGELLALLGKHRLGKSCLYIKRLSDIDLSVLETLVRQGLVALGGQGPVEAS